MVLRALFTLVLGWGGLVGFGQSMAPGYVITTGRDSLRGAVFLGSDQAQQARVDFILLHGNQRLQLDAHQLKAYGYVRKQDTVRYVSVAFNTSSRRPGNRRIFLRQLASGPVELYKYYYSKANAPDAAPLLAGSSPGMGSRAGAGTRTNWSAPSGLGAAAAPVPARSGAFGPLSVNSARFGTGSSLLLHRRDQHATVEITWWDFPTDAAAYFADYPALAAELLAGHYRPRDIDLIVRRYNAWHAARGLR